MLKSDKTRWGPARPDPTSRHDFTEVPGTQTEHLFLVPHLINSWKVYWTLGSNRSVNKEWAYLQFNLKKMAPRSTNNEDPKYLAWVLMDAVSSSEVFTNAFASCAFEPTSVHPSGVKPPLVWFLFLHHSLLRHLFLHRSAWVRVTLHFTVVPAGPERGPLFLMSLSMMTFGLSLDLFKVQSWKNRLRKPYFCHLSDFCT